jgi:hypothetical protein
VAPRDRRNVTAWDLGLSAVAPGIPSSEILPFGSIYLWRRPDDDTYFRGILVGLYDDIFFAKSAESIRPLEGVFTFENYTVPFARSQPVDGHKLDEEELIWGSVRGGAGVGIRRPLPRPLSDDPPGTDHNENMAALDLIVEPGYLFFDDGKDTAPNFTVPQDTFEGRVHLRGRFDRISRNLLELAHRGFALGADLVLGGRADWEDWGTNRTERGSAGRGYLAFSGFAAGASPVPFVASERHRLVGTLHGGIGSGLDRFSGFRVGGGPSGQEFEALSRPIIPGAQIEEFVSSRYVVAVAEYRWEPIFFTYIGVRGGVAYLDRRRLGPSGFFQSDDVLPSVGARITTGFLFETQLQLEYDYNFGVIRKDEYGGHGVTMHVSRQF